MKIPIEQSSLVDAAVKVTPPKLMFENHTAVQCC